MSNTHSNISIIIPAYNSEKHVTQCLNSLLTQDLIPFEVICINDASTDSTPLILSEFAHKYSNIKVLNNTHNLGPAHCRNMGLAHASGDYIWFIDSDDWVQDNAIETLRHLLDQTNADVVGFRAQAYNNKTRRIHLDKFRDLSVIPESFFQKDFNFSQGKSFLFLLPQELWSRVFKKEFLIENNIKFDTEVWGLDDGIFVNECLICSKLIFFSKDILYNYRTNNPKSIIAGFDKPNVKIYDAPIVYARKCDQLLEKYQLPTEDCQTLILRNIDRIIRIFTKLKGSLKPSFFNKFKTYLIESQVSKLDFVKASPCYSLLKEFELLSYWKYFLKNYIFQVFESNTFKRIKVFQITIYKQQKMHNLIKGRFVFSIFKTMAYVQKNYNEIHYIFLGFLIYKRKQLT